MASKRRVLRKGRAYGPIILAMSVSQDASRPSPSLPLLYRHWDGGAWTIPPLFGILHPPAPLGSPLGFCCRDRSAPPSRSVRRRAPQSPSSASLWPVVAVRLHEGTSQPLDRSLSHSSLAGEISEGLFCCLQCQLSHLRKRDPSLMGFTMGLYWTLFEFSYIGLGFIKCLLLSYEPTLTLDIFCLKRVFLSICFHF